ncbi:protein mono-ADP-ribosyltransferase PARP3-like [Paramacrobiotus metropolitanus]|uniref:protein mono-ADP-ribosyltransferase PARP3-like n=1 Tax=Paramacrobiotus metropolitanus TaxID=2943436 RepID=UPI002445F04F|nr:protein mono-ADP-ribosyltransferase PARP3-like [Paramacrobiotus metropolitanus]
MPPKRKVIAKKTAPKKAAPVSAKTRGKPPTKKATAASAKKSATTSAAQPDVDWSSLTVAKLKEELEARDLDTSGKKADLIRRLEEADEDESGPSTKKTKASDGQPKSVIQKAIDKLKKSNKNKAAVSYKVDTLAASQNPGIYAGVHEDYSFMLNQTNIGNNNNKFYVGQLLHRNDGKFDVFTKWGRVGEPGAVQFLGPSDITEAIQAFGKKFHDKTGNKWENRDDFQPKSGKYTLLEMEASDEDTSATVAVDTSNQIVGDPKAKCSLEEVTQDLVNLIFDHDMFNDAMQKLNLDTKKMPLGKLSKSQIARGFEVLEKIESALKDGDATNATLTQLSNEFYTVIPHDFKRSRPPVIDSLGTVQDKFDMLATLGDIEIAQEMQKSQKGSSQKHHPCDIKYDLLKCKLHLVDSSSKEFKVIQKYFDSTKWNNSNMKLKHIWEVDRESEGPRFKNHNTIQHRKLLWHGTNVAVVAAILKTGLRIMPHSGGRVGKGIYFASENAKSAGYTRPAKNTGLMFLNEVALGNEWEITQDDSSLVSAPSGYDSVVARGQVEPDPKFDVKLKFDGHEVIIPQGNPIQQGKFNRSSFSQSEYLVYRESQVRIRYLLAFDWGYPGF